MNKLLNHLYNQAWDPKNIRLSYSAKQNLYGAGLIVLLGFVISKRIEKTK
jgi:hypothetical protein